MGYDEELLSRIQSELNAIATSFADNVIVFDGEVAFYDHDWIKKQYEKDITPFALTVEGSDTRVEGKPITTNQYAIGFLCKEKLSEEYKEIFDIFYENMKNYSFKVGQTSYYVRPTDKLRSVPFSEGSGKAEKRFEQIIRLEVVIADGLYSGKDVIINFDGFELPIRTFKILYGISDYATMGERYSNNANNYNNKMTVVAEVYVNRDIISAGFLEYTSDVNIQGSFDVEGFLDIYNGTASYNGYEMAGEYNGILTAYLYFTIKPTSTTESFTLNGIAFPIIDYSIAMKNITKTISAPNSNLTKDVYVGKARAYVFNVLKTNVTAVASIYNLIFDSLLGDGDNANNQYLTLGMTLGGNTYTKTVAISDITDESSNKGVWRITMTEGAIL